MPASFSIDQNVFEQLNIAEFLDEKILDKIGECVVEEYKADDASRSQWLDNISEWMKLAQQVMETKNSPWPNASNIKYPLLTVSAIQFNSRALPALVADRYPVKPIILGINTALDEEKKARQERVQHYLSYQILYGMPSWIDDMDRLLIYLPIVGLCHKKTYFSAEQGLNISKLVMPEDLAIDYYAEDYDKARKTERMYLYKNSIIELQRKGLYREIDIGESKQPADFKKNRDAGQGLSQPGAVKEYPYEILEAHTYYDLDEDDYKEPWTITVVKETGKVLRIVPRFAEDGVEHDQTGRIISIRPLLAFTKYIFFPDPNSNTHGLGLGHLLGPLNKGANTVLNQLIDAGTLANMPGGFLGKGIRSKTGVLKFKPGEWKILQTTAQDLRQGIVPLAIKDPSNVLFQLLGLLIDSGKEVGSIADVMLGQNPGQNQPFSTTQNVLEQGLKVFAGIYKRIFRSLSSEYRKLYMLTYIYGDDTQYRNILDYPTNISVEQDFSPLDADIIPNADPDIIAEHVKLMRAQSLAQKIAAGFPINAKEATKRILEAEGHKDIETLLQVPKPQPSFELQLKDKEIEYNRENNMIAAELDSIRVENEALKDRAQAQVNEAKAEAVGFNEITKRIGEVTKRITALKGAQNDKSNTGNRTSED